LAVGRSRDTRSIRHRGDGTKTFRGLGVCDGLASGSIDTRVVGVVSIARFEYFILGIVGGIVSAANAVEDVLTVACTIGSRRITDLQAKSIAAHEVGPLNDLNVRTSPSVGEDDTTHRVATEISTVGVQFTSVVAIGYIDLGLVNETNDLDVVGGF